MSAYVVAVLGATGLVGQRLVRLLDERQFPVKAFKPLASAHSVGQPVTFRGQTVPVEEATPEAFEGVDLVLASAGGSISQKLVPEAISRGAVVVDNTSCFRMNPHVPLVVAGVNDDDLTNHPGVIANPNCSTAQLMPVLKALMTLSSLERVVVSTYQSVSGAGKKAMDELQTCTQSSLDSENYQCFDRPMAFNLIPKIDVFLDDPTYGGYTKEEWKLIVETRKILHLPDLAITATAVRVPVMIGHSESVTVDFKTPVTVDQVKAVLNQTPDVVVSATDNDYPTPRQIAGQHPVFVGRIRPDTSNPGRGINCWVVADNLMIGAALNAVRLAEALHHRGLITSKASQSPLLGAVSS